MAECRLYLVTPATLDPETFAPKLTAALDAGDVASVQLRLKNVDDDAIRHAARVLMPIVHAHDAAFILNDNPVLAAELGCDGVHIGQSDGSYADARAAVGAGAAVGVTCHNSSHFAMEAAENGADYVAFGAFYPTATKDSGYRAEPEVLEWWSGYTVIPCVAIGGITPENCEPLVVAGADFLAVVSAVWDHPAGPAVAVRSFIEAIARAES
ncbi:MAG: thiamine phosphate synthase [Rhodospirillales bacterium]|nr:thiamine phosphate synthase [Rhodospirillales bacterium]